MSPIFGDWFALESVDGEDLFETFLLVEVAWDDYDHGKHTGLAKLLMNLLQEAV